MTRRRRSTSTTPWARSAYGDWTGRELKTLRREPLWAVVQGHPSAAVFPGGEALAAMSARAVAAVRRWNAVLGPDATYALVSHGDVIKAILADALAIHLDGFQRLGVDPCALSVVRYGPAAAARGARQRHRRRRRGAAAEGRSRAPRIARIERGGDAERRAR